MNTPVGNYEGSVLWRTARKPWKCRGRMKLDGRPNPPAHHVDIAIGERHLEAFFDSGIWERNNDRYCEACADAALGDEAQAVMFGRVPHVWQRGPDCAPAWYDFKEALQFGKR